MSDRIEPALTGEQWSGITASLDVEVPLGESGRLTIATDDRSALWLREDAGSDFRDQVEVRVDQAPAVIAALNHLLADSDPRKITREKIDQHIRRQAEAAIADHKGAENWGWVKDALAFADALESYVPPNQ